MLKYTDYDIVFQEFPDEVTLAINLSLCPNRCKGCHSPQLQQDIGHELTTDVIDRLIEKYGEAITCIGLMGGDNDLDAVAKTAEHICKTTDKKVGWYSGREKLNSDFPIRWFSYIKLGPYVEALGGLKSPQTNQRLYKIYDKHFIDITHPFINNMDANDSCSID